MLGDLSLRPQKSQVPVGNLAVDWSHPLAAGLVACYVPGVMRGRDLTGNLAHDLVNVGGSSVLKSSADGPALYVPSAAANGGFYSNSLPSSDPLITATTRTMFFRFRNITPDTTNEPYWFSVNYDNAAGSPFTLSGIYPGAGGTTLGLGTNQNGIAAANTLAGFTSSKISIAATFNVGTAMEGFADGVSLGTIATTGAAPTAGATANIQLGGEVGYAHSSEAEFSVAYYWTRLLSSSDILYLHLNPYCLLRQASAFDSFGLSVKGLIYSLIGTTASYAETPSTLTAKTARKLVGTSTSYAETASALTIKRGLVLTSSSYAETASSLTPKVARNLSGASTSYAETASPLTAKTSRLQSLTSTSYAETPSSITVKRGLPLTSATYSETASSLTAKTARSLTGTSASYSETASSLTIKRGLSLTSASYAETPSTLTAKTARSLSLTTASYAETASQLTPKVARKILGTSATYALTDATAIAKATRFLQGLSTSYALSDSTATFIVASGASLIGLSASYAVTPSTATLKHAAKLAMSSSSYALTASTANLIYSPGGVTPAGVADWITLARRRGRR